MSCPHSLHDSPDRCSQCLGVAVRRVEQDGASVVISDGEQQERRGIDPGADPFVQVPAEQRRKNRGKR